MDAGTPDWWLTRLYKRLHDRAPTIKVWDDWYSGDHPMPRGHEKAGPLLLRLFETTGLNMLATVTDAAMDRMALEGFKIDGKSSDDAWDLWQRNKFDLHSLQVRQERMALSASYVMVDPNNGDPIYTPEHPLQCITENYPGSTRRAAGIKVYLDDLGDTPLVRATVLLEDRVQSYAAPCRIYASGRSSLALQPAWELQAEGSGGNSLGEVPLVPFLNRERLLKDPRPEWMPALGTQKRINKTLLDRMSIQDQTSFKAMWATGLKIPEDPATGAPIEPFQRAIDRLFVNEDPDGRFGQFEADDIKQLLEAVRDDIADCAMLVPTSPDAILGKLVNVSGDGLKLAQVSELKRVRKHMRYEDEPWEDVTRLGLKGAGKSVPNVGSMSSIWRNPEFRTEGELADAATKSLQNGMPHEAVWERYYGATPDEQRDWRARLDADGIDPVLARITRPIGQGATGGDAGGSTLGS